MNVSRALLRWRSIRFLCAGGSLLAATAAAGPAAAAGSVTVLSVGAPSPQASGVAFPVNVVLQSTNTSSNVCATLIAAEAGGNANVSGPSTQCAGNLNNGQQATLTWPVTFTLTGPGAGSVTFISSVSWSEGATAFAGAPVTVIPAAAPAQLAVQAVTPSKTTVFTSESFTVNVAIANGAAAGSNSANVTQVTLVESGGGSSPSCGTPTTTGTGPLPPGATRTYQFTCQASAPGSYRLAGRAIGADASSGQALSGGPLSSPLITVNSAAAGLQVTSVVATPSVVADGQTIAVDAFVKNTALAGGHAATSVAIALSANTPSAGNGSATGCVQTSATDNSPLPAQAQRKISFSCTGTGHGTFTFRAAATGLDAGVALSGSGASAAVTITDDQSPTVSIQPSPVPWSSADVNFELTGTDNPNGSGVASVTVQIDGGPLTVTAASHVSVSLTAEAQHTISFFASDRAGNNSATTAVTAGIDRTAPGVVGSQSPPANAAGWNRGAVSVSFACSDSLSGVQSCTPPVALAAETAGTTVPGVATDRAGNGGSTSFGPVKIDLTPPSISGALVDEANANGWFGQPATVRFTCTDALSGIATCPGDLLMSTEGTGQASMGTAVDIAGNSASASVGGINIDLTPPVVTGSRAPVANASGWNNTDVTVSFSCTDALSGIASCSSPTTVAAEGQNQSVTGAATDRAGHSGSVKVEGISIDRTAPIIDVSTAPPANAAGWNNTDVTATFTCSDGLSGVVAGSCPTPQVYATDGHFQAAGTVEDRAGNTASRSAGVNLDKTPPAIAGTRAPAANANGWNASPVTVSFDCTDALSGIATCSAAKVLASEGTGQSAAGTATDVAGSSASTAVNGINIDLTPPVITGAASPPANFAGWNNQPVAVHFACTDALSGIDTCTPDLLLATEGQYTVLGAARDRAGNVAPGALPFPVKVDMTPPVVTVPSSPLVAEATEALGAAVSFSVSALDATSGALPGSLACLTEGGATSSGDVFPLGDTTITCAAVDLAGNTGAASFVVQVRDTTPPVLASVSDLVAMATSDSGAVVTFDAPLATDLVDGALVATCDHASGAIYPVGVTVVGCSASDQHGNTSGLSFRITVRARAAAPVIGKVPGTNDHDELLAFATTVHGATVKYTLPTATDSAGQLVPVTCTPAPGTRFAVGKTTVNCSAVDAAGNAASAAFTVWVQFKVAADGQGNIFEAPINGDGSSIFKIGHAVPVRFRLAGASAKIKNLVAYISIVKTSDAIEGTHDEVTCFVIPTPGNRFFHNFFTNQYFLNLPTRHLAQGTYRISASLTDGNGQRLGDGVVHTVQISLRK